MSWFRIAYAYYPSAIAARQMPGIAKINRPKMVSIESSESGPKFEAVNIVYYRDDGMEEFINDFFFETIDEAIGYCEVELGLPRESLVYFEEPQKLFD